MLTTLAAATARKAMYLWSMGAPSEEEYLLIQEHGYSKNVLEMQVGDFLEKKSWNVSCIATCGINSLVKKNQIHQSTKFLEPNGSHQGTGRCTEVSHPHLSVRRSFVINICKAAVNVVTTTVDHDIHM